MNLSASHLALFSLFSDAYVLALAKPIPDAHQKKGEGKSDCSQMSIFLNVLFNSVNVKVEMPKSERYEKEGRVGLIYSA